MSTKGAPRDTADTGGQRDQWLLPCLAPQGYDLEPTPQGLGLRIPTVGSQHTLPPNPQAHGGEPVK